MLSAILISNICIAVNDFFSTGQCLVCTAIFLEVQPCVHFCLIGIGDIFIPINSRCVIINWYSSTATIRKTAFHVYKTQHFLGGWVILSMDSVFQSVEKLINVSIILNDGKSAKSIQIKHILSCIEMNVLLAKICFFLFIWR